MPVALRTKNLKEGKKSYYLDIYHNGERNYEFLKMYISPKDSKEDKKEKKLLAERIRAKREIEISSEEYDFIPSHKKKIDFILYFQKFIEDYNGAGIRKFISSLNKFTAYLNKEKLPFNKLNKKICQEYCDFLKSSESGLSGETPSDYFKRFQRVINKAITDGIINANPAKGISIKKDSNVKKEVLTSEELQKLANTECGNSEVKKAFLFACFTGLGEAEIRKLTWSRISDDTLKTNREKNGKPVFVPLSPVALKLIGEKGKPNEPIFNVLPTGTAINKCIKTWVKRAEIEKKITFYCGRHTFAIQLIKGKTDLNTVKNLMGHSDIATTVKYLNYIKDLEEEAIGNLPELKLNI